MRYVFREYKPTPTQESSGAVKDTSRIYYRDEILAGDARVSFEYSYKDFKSEQGPDTKVQFGFDLYGSHYVCIDMHGDPVQRAMLLKRFLEDGISKSQNDLLAHYDKKQWEYVIIDNSQIYEILGENSVAIPLKPAKVLDTELLVHDQKTVLDIVDSFITDKLSVNQIAQKYRVSEIYVNKILTHVRRRGKLPDYRLLSTRRSKERVVLPDAVEVRSLLAESYRSTGNAGLNWREFVAKLKKKWPHLNECKPKTIQNKARLQYKIKSLPANVRYRNRSGQEEMHLRCVVQGSLVHSRLSSDKPLIFFDQSTFRMTTSTSCALGFGGIVPIINIKKPGREVHMQAAFDKDGIIAVWFSLKSATIEQASYFTRYVCRKYMKDRSITSCEVYLDNCQYQKSKSFKKMCRSEHIRLIYGIPGAPFINVIENYFLFVKTNLRKLGLLDYDSYLAAIAGALVHTPIDVERMFRMFYDDMLECIYNYRVLTDRGSGSGMVTGIVFMI